MSQDVGKILILPKSTWVNNTTYEILDAVTYEGKAYISKQSNNIGHTPSGQTDTYWFMFAKDGREITGISKTGSTTVDGRVVDTYTITYSEGNADTFTVTNGKDGTNGTNGADGADGRGIVSISKTGSATVDGRIVDTYTITYTTGDPTTFTVTNGKDGAGSGDMLASVYDSNGNVANAGGIAGYVSGQTTGKADKVTSATEGNFAALDSNGNLVDSGHKHSDYLTQHQDISGKADKVSGATNGNFAGLDSNGNLTDSGKKPSDFLTQHQDISDRYSTNDTAETTLDDADYVPFYDSSASAKRRTLWSNIKSVLKTYFDNLYSTVKTRGTPVSEGTALSLVNTGDMYAWNNKQNAPTVLTATLATPNTQVTFTNAAITANAKIRVYTNVPGLNYESMDASTANTIVLTYEAQNSNITVMLEIW